MPVTYSCGRCGFITTYRSHMRTHLHKKKVCDPIYSDVDRDTLLKALDTPEGKKTAFTTYSCGRCGYCTERLSNIKAHLITIKICDPIYSDVDRDTLLKALDTPEGKKSAYVENLITDSPTSHTSNEDKDAYIRNLQKIIYQLRHENMKLLHSKPEQPEAIEVSPPPVVQEKEKDDTIRCSKCDESFESRDELEVHIRVECDLAVHFDSVYTYNQATFGRSLYPNDKDSGDIYIVQTDFSNDGKRYYKVGKTTNVMRRMIQYRTGSVKEPRLHCYYPFRNMSRADVDLKESLGDHHLKREIYTFDDVSALKATIRGYQMRVDGCIAEFSPMLSPT